MHLARFFLLLALVPSLSARAAKPITLVFILTDNQGAWTLGSYGNPDIRTLHNDKLAAKGIRITRTLSSNPAATPLDPPASPG
jgi:arylsulfatase A-like enzyme